MKLELKQYRDIINSMGDAIHLADTELRIILVNKEFKRWLKRLKLNPNITGKKVFDAFPFLSKNVLYEYKKVLRTGQTVVTGGINKIKNKEILTETRKIPVFIENKVTGILTVIRDITPYKNAEKTLRESEERYRRLFEHTPLGIGLASLEGKVITCNKAMTDITGYSLEEFKNISLIDTYDNPTDRKRLLKNIKRYGKVVNFPVRLKRKDGTKYDALLNISRIQIGDETLLQTIHIDVTEQKKTIEALKNSENMYKTLTEASPDAVTITDLEGNITRVSRQTLKLHGYKSHKELIGKSAFELIDPKDHNRAMVNLKKTLKKGLVKNLEYTLLKKDTTPFIGELNAALIKDAYGNPKAFIATTRDITERKKAEEQILIANKRLKHLISSTSAVIYASKTYGDYNATFITDNVTEMVGYKPYEFIKKPNFWLDRVHPDDRQRILSDVSNVFKRGIHSYEYRFKHKNGEYIWVRDERRLLKDKKGKPIEIIGFWIDITKLKQLEQMQDNLIRDVSHSLKNPIAILEMACNMVEEGIKTKDIERIKKGRDIAAPNVGKIKKDVDNVIALFTLDRRLREEKQRKKIKQKGSLKRVIYDVIREMKNLIEEKNIELKIDIPEEANKIIVNKIDMKTLISNILDNAIKFTEKGNISIISRLKGRWLMIKIEDTGCGLTPEYTDKVFDRFYKGHPRVSGTGIGLEICKEIVDIYGGKIRFLSKGEGKGTAVTINLPR